MKSPKAGVEDGAPQMLLYPSQDWTDIDADASVEVR